jgi:hypothetical protein
MARSRIWAEKVNRECCSPYYGVLVRKDEQERKEHFASLLKGLQVHIVAIYTRTVFNFLFGADQQPLVILPSPPLHIIFFTVAMAMAECLALVFLFYHRFPPNPTKSRLLTKPFFNVFHITGPVDCLLCGSG